MVNVVVWSEVDISSISGGVMVNVVVWSEVDISSISGGVMVNVLVSSEVNLRWCQTKDYDNCMCCFFTPHITLRNTSNHWMSRNQNNVSEYCKLTISWTVVSSHLNVFLNFFCIYELKIVVIK